MKSVYFPSTKSKFLWDDIKHITVIVFVLLNDLFPVLLPSRSRFELSFCFTPFRTFPPWLLYLFSFHHHSLSMTSQLMSNPSSFQRCHRRPQFNWKPCLLLSFLTFLYLYRFYFWRLPPAGIQLKRTSHHRATKSLISSCLQADEVIGTVRKYRRGYRRENDEQYLTRSSCISRATKLFSK